MPSFPVDRHPALMNFFCLQDSHVEFRNALLTALIPAFRLDAPPRQNVPESALRPSTPVDPLGVDRECRSTVFDRS